MATANRSAPSPASLGKPQESFWKRTQAGRTAAVYIAPALLLMLLMTFYPLVYQFWMSFTEYGIIRRADGTTFQTLNPSGANYREPPFVGFQNYTDILSGELNKRLPNFDFWRNLGFNLWWTFSNVFFHVALGIVIAVLLNTEGLWGRKLYRAIFILPMVIPNIVIATVWRNMFDDQYGAINQLLTMLVMPFTGAPFELRWFNEINEPVPGLPWSYFAMLIANIWLGWPFMTIVATGALQSIPKELYEAASIDGATGWDQFVRITLPLLRPAMVPAAMVGMVTTFNLFHVIYFMSAGGPLGKTEILVTQAFRLINEQRLYGMAAAFCVLIFCVLVPIFLITNRISKATENYDV
jgi:arabinogalactan oligomer/maltooligosaccharide transport system permease protein